MIFSMEALQADEGDALILHYGARGQPKFVVVDGGPRGVYRKSLAPRLAELNQKWGVDGVLEIPLVMVSHIDADHIAGILDLTNELRHAQSEETTIAYDILTLWHNSFDDLVRPMRNASELLAELVSRANPQSPDRAAIAASVSQGKVLRENAEKLHININAGFVELVSAPSRGMQSVSIDSDLHFAIIGPRQTQLDALEADWRRFLAKARRAKGRGRSAGLSAADISALAAEYLDKSVPNLSSIVAIATCGERRMLLTGDARGDNIIEGLLSAGLLGSPPLTVDLLKVPHHGSCRNVEQGFFETVHAEHYVISADGKHGNPDPETLQMLFAARPVGPYQIHLTNETAAIRALLGNRGVIPAGVHVDIRPTTVTSVRVDLGEPVDY